jgi:2-oxo-4-hydroxy-4-carboxy-5-ureidoimidazoline decarboxylase
VHFPWKPLAGRSLAAAVAQCGFSQLHQRLAPPGRHMTIAQVNAMPRSEFVQELGWVFEQSPWVAGRAWEKRPFESVEALHAAMTAAMHAAAYHEQLAILCAHPELGSKAPMSDASTGEQAGAGLDSVGPFQREHLRQYRQKFGFPFLYAVKGSPMSDIFFALSIRIDDSPEQEFQQALREVSRIAWFRLQDKFKEI